MEGRTKVKMITEGRGFTITLKIKDSKEVKLWEIGEAGYIEQILVDSSTFGGGFSIIVVLGKKLVKCYAKDIEIIIQA